MHGPVTAATPEISAAISPMEQPTVVTTPVVPTRRSIRKRKVRVIYEPPCDRRKPRCGRKKGSRSKKKNGGSRKQTAKERIEELEKEAAYLEKKVKEAEAMAELASIPGMEKLAFAICYAIPSCLRE